MYLKGEIHPRKAFHLSMGAAEGVNRETDRAGPSATSFYFNGLRGTRSSAMAAW